MSDLRSRLGTHRWSGPLVTSVLAIGIAGVVLATGIPTLIGAISSPSWDGNDDDIFASLEQAHDRQAEASSRRFLGRSPFVVPGRPQTRPAAPKPRPERPKPEPRPEPPKVDPGPPSTYTGPAPTGVAGPLVFFGSNDQIPLGQEKNGVKVLALIGPTAVRLGHKGGTYEVNFLDDDFSTIFKPFSDSIDPGVLGKAPEGAGEPEPSEPSEPSESVASTAPAAVSEPWSPQRGSAVKVTFNDRGEDRTIFGRIQYLGRGGDGKGRSMVVRGEVDGRAVFQRIDESQVIEMGEAPDDMVPPIDDDDGVDEEPLSDEDVSPNLAETLRNMSNAQLESRHYQLTEILNRPELGDEMRDGLETELRLINDILRGQSNDG